MTLCNALFGMNILKLDGKHPKNEYSTDWEQKKLNKLLLRLPRTMYRVNWMCLLAFASHIHTGSPYNKSEFSNQHRFSIWLNTTNHLHSNSMIAFDCILWIKNTEFIQFGLSDLCRWIYLISTIVFCCYCRCRHCVIDFVMNCVRWNRLCLRTMATKLEIWEIKLVRCCGDVVMWPLPKTEST